MRAFLGVKWCTIVAFLILPKKFLQNLFLKLQAKIYLANQFAGFFLIFDMLKTIWKPMYFMISNTYSQSMLF